MANPILKLGLPKGSLEGEVQLGDAKHIRVLYEDEHLIIVDKPAGMKTHPTFEYNNSNEFISLSPLKVGLNQLSILVAIL